MEQSTTGNSDQVASRDDVLRRAGVTVQTTAGVTRIDIPPVPSAKFLRKHVIWIVILGAFVLFASVISIREPTMVVAAVEYGLILTLVVAHFAGRLRRHLLFEIDDDSVKLFNVYGRKPKPGRSWSRGEVTETRIITNGKLWIRAHHEQVAEIYLTPWQNVNEAIAAQLRASIAASHADARQNRELWYAPSTLGDEKTRGGRKRVVLLILAIALSVCGFASLIFGAWSVSMLFFILATAPAGASLGTQDRDFYF